MRRLGVSALVLCLSGGLALAQSSGGSGSSGSSSSTGASGGASSPGSSVGGPSNPGPSPATPGLNNPPAPSDSSTVGRAPSTNPANSQDQLNRGNPQDLTRPGASNPQDMKPSGPTPNIIVPERR